MTREEMVACLTEGLTADQEAAVSSSKRRVLVVAGAGSGKTEVMARRIAWWVGIENAPKDRLVAFTFTERAAEEMKFRIRRWLERITPDGQEVSLGGMYVGTIHGYCLAKLREFWPDEYHNTDILDEAARASLVLRGFNGVLGLAGLRGALGRGQWATAETFLSAYDQLHEHDRFRVRLAPGNPPQRLGEAEREWCKEAELLTEVGQGEPARAFAVCAARYYAYLRCRRFLDFSTSQTEILKALNGDAERLRLMAAAGVWLVVDEVQDINPVQRELVRALVGSTGRLTAVGDHRQAIYGFRGARVEIIGELWEEFKQAADADVVDLKENFRSTPRILEIANRWAETISPLGNMTTPAMLHGNTARTDYHPSHVAVVDFDNRGDEARWIAGAIRALVPDEEDGALHDKRGGTTRGLALSDLAVLVRSSTDVRTYMSALEAAGIPAVVRAGPDLFSQPEVLLFVSAIGISAGHEKFYGGGYGSLPDRIKKVLGVGEGTEEVLAAASAAVRQAGLPFSAATAERLLKAAKALAARIRDGTALGRADTRGFRTPRLRQFLTAGGQLRRVFPQDIYHMLLSEAEVEQWDTTSGRGQQALFHLGALSGLVTGIETPGWTSTTDYPWQIIGLLQYGTAQGRAEEQPLMVQPDAVTVSTIHGVKGLEFAAVFLADVASRRFPSQMARRKPDFPLDGPILDEIDVEGLRDNENHDGERRLMYVAATRAERFLFITHSGGAGGSRFVQEMRRIVRDSGGRVTTDPGVLLQELKYAPKEHRRDLRLATSFSDLRYYLECPHDFYLRKVLGFAPTIDQAFGYGRGVHNLLRAIHAEPKRWAALAADRGALEAELGRLIDRGLFYLRYTTGEPADNMRAKGIRVVADYVGRYVRELDTLTFEPEKQFETLVDYEDQPGAGALISGAIDIIRRDDPPQVTLIDFKSGEPSSDKHQSLDEEEMQLQVALYAIAAKKELEYQPDRGLVRYLDGDPARLELSVPLDDVSVQAARKLVTGTAGKIRDRVFKEGPAVRAGRGERCPTCDFVGFCGMDPATAHKRSAKADW